ncbi:hypothetical protein BDF22DRAFT_653653 [Syncephalis plumigaleata]|nr:hypothetical protein BDF22DRAFT_653653 [Syncephalis plumigaleata]
MYTYGGFHQYSDEVYCDVNRLTLETYIGNHLWCVQMLANLIKRRCKRIIIIICNSSNQQQQQQQQQHLHNQSSTGEQMNIDDGMPALYDHTTSLWRDKVLVVFGGHDLEGCALSDIILIDLNTSNDNIVRWRFAYCHGSLPGPRAKHAAAIIEDTLYVSGGYARVNGSVEVYNDLCRLNLLTGEWLEPVPFTARYSHQLLVCNDGRLLAYGGYNADMEPLSELTFFDPSVLDAAHLDGDMLLGLTTAAADVEQQTPQSQSQSQSHHQQQQQSQQVIRVYVQGDQAPGRSGQHFAGIFGDRLVVLVTRCVSSGHSDLVGLWSMDLPRLTWQRHAEADELAEQLAAGSWHYAVPSKEGDRWWLFGAAENTDAEEYLGTVVELDLREHGVLPMPPSDIGDNLVSMLNDPRFADFTITAVGKSRGDGGEAATTQGQGQMASFRVHKCIIASRWPHFANMLASDTLESTQGELRLPEPPRVVKAFLGYLYSDTLEIAAATSELSDSNNGKISASAKAHEDNDTIARLLVLANLYCLPRLQRLCCQRLHDTLRIDNAASIWQHARIAGEHGLVRRVVRYIFEHFGAVCQTAGFRDLHPNDLAYFWEQVPREAKICVEISPCL